MPPVNHLQKCLINVICGTFDIKSNHFGPVIPKTLEKFQRILLTPGNDRGVTPHSIDQSNQFRSRALRSIEHERIHDFHSKQFSCRQPFN